MKALSGYAEWFWLMALNIKDVENRNWELNRYVRPMELPLRIYLHASKTPASEEDKDFIIDLLTEAEYMQWRAVNWNALRGAIIGEVTVTGYSHVGQQASILLAGTGPNHSRWLFGEYGFWVKDGVLYDKPIPVKGHLGFWEVA